MNRRRFLTRLGAALAGALVAPHVAFSDAPTPLFEGFIPAGPIGEFEIVYYWQGELLCDNPSKCFVLADIAE